MYNVSNASVPSVRCSRSVLSSQAAKVASRRLRSWHVSRRICHCGHRLWCFACKEPVAAAAHSGCLINKCRQHKTQSGSANRSRRPRFDRDLCYFVFEFKKSMEQHFGSDRSELCGVGLADAHTAVVPVRWPTTYDVAQEHEFHFVQALGESHR